MFVNQCTNVCMQWLHAMMVVIAGALCNLYVAITILDCIQLLHSSHACKQTVADTRTVGVGYVDRRFSTTVSTCTIWACARLTEHHQWCKQSARAKAWHACSRDFTSVAVYLVVQIELSKQMHKNLHTETDRQTRWLPHMCMPLRLHPPRHKIHNYTGELLQQNKTILSYA